MSGRSALVVAALGLALVGCDTPQPCQPDGSCPPNTTCVAGLCRNTLGVQVEPDSGAGGSDAAGCPTSLGPAARVGAAGARFRGGVAIVGGHDHIGRCDVEPVAATASAHRFDPCGGFEALADVPGTRYGAMAAVAADGALWVVGGRRDVATGASVPLGDAWRLAKGATTWQEGASAEVAARSHGALVATLAPPALWLYGGDISVSQNAPIATGDLRRLATSADAAGAAFEPQSWTLPATKGDAPGPRRGHAMAAIAGELVLVGGLDGAGNASDEVFALDLSKLTWRRLSLLLGGPTARAGASVAALPQGRLLLFGGADEDWGERNDLWSLDVAAGRWTRVRAGDLGADGAVDGAIGAAPDACNLPPDALTLSTTDPERRADAALVADANAELLWLFGGRGPCGALGDLWRLDTATFAWTRLRGAGPGGACPLRRGGCSALCKP